MGPDAEGRFPEESRRVLEGIGRWMEKNARSIRGCGYAELPKPEWGRYTRNGGRLYAHVLEAPIGPLALTGLRKSQVGSVRLLSDGSEVLCGDSWNTGAYGDIPFVSLDSVRGLSRTWTDYDDIVLEIRLKGEE